MSFPTLSDKYMHLSPEDPFKIEPTVFHNWKSKRVLFIDSLDISGHYLLFRILPSGSSMRPHTYSDIDYVASVEVLISAARGTNTVSFSNYLIFTYEMYGKEWFALRII